MKEIKLLKNNEKLELSDVEWTDKLYQFLVKEVKLREKKAFSIIYFLQEYLPVIPDHIERCDVCGSLFDSYAVGHLSDLTGKHYCSESCEPPRLYERELAAERKAEAKNSRP
jgi:hypothetical protein